MIKAEFKIGTKIFSTIQIEVGIIENINDNTIDLRCETWQTRNAIGNNMLVRFDKSYLFENNGLIEMYQKSPEDKEVWGRILKG